MTTYPLGSAGVSLAGSVTVPDPVAGFPERYSYNFSSGLEFWGSSGPCNAAGGVFHSDTWSPDDNHLTTKGGPGRLHLLAFRDHAGWEDQSADGQWIGSNFLNARINATVRGVSFVPNGSDWIIWIQARHPSVAGKFVNWARVGDILTPKLMVGGWQSFSVVLDDDPAKWVWGKGNGIYDTFLPITDALKNIHNLHMPVLGPDGIGAPSGAFEIQNFEIIFQRNGSSQPAAIPSSTMTWGDKGAGVTLSADKLTASFAGSGFSTTRASQPIAANRYWEVKINSFSAGVMAGVANTNAPLSSSTIYVGADANGFGWYRNGDVYHSAALVAQISSFVAGDTLGFWTDGTNLWASKNGVVQNSGNPIVTGLSTSYYPAVSDGSSSADTASVTANFSGPFLYTPPSGYSGF